MITRTKTIAASLFMGAAILFTPVSPASAQTTVGDGLVNVAVGDVNVLNDSPITVAAQVAAQVCGVSVGPVAVLAEQVDASGKKATVCKTAQGPVTIRNK